MTRGPALDIAIDIHIVANTRAQARHAACNGAPCYGVPQDAATPLRPPPPRKRRSARMPPYEPLPARDARLARERRALALAAADRALAALAVERDERLAAEMAEWEEATADDGLGAPDASAGAR
jgi:hypothetical protein